MSKEEGRMREMAYEIVEGVGFEKAIRAERERYREEHPEHFQGITPIGGRSNHPLPPLQDFEQPLPEPGFKWKSPNSY